MSPHRVSPHRVSAGETLDTIAAALTPDVIVPFEAPARPMLLGGRDTYCIRPGYIARNADETSQHVTAHPGAHSGVDAIIERLSDSFGADRVRTSIDVLSRHSAPALLVRDLAASLGANDVLVLSTRVRALNKVFDHPGPPDDPSHYREWTFPELHAFLDAEGLDVVFGGLAVGQPVAMADSSAGTAVMIAVKPQPSRPRRTP